MNRTKSNSELNDKASRISNNNDLAAVNREHTAPASRRPDAQLLKPENVVMQDKEIKNAGFEFGRGGAIPPVIKAYVIGPRKRSRIR